MILITTDAKAREYKGAVFGEVALGNSTAKDLKASVKSFTGGRAEGYEEGLKEAREAALGILKDEAEKLGADAVIGVKLKYDLISNGSMLIVTASGTAVKM